jgi:hypothetical protein
MKRNFVLSLFLFLSPLYAFGDFVPGRVRAAAKAELTSVSGDGSFREVRSARAFLLQTDGKGLTGLRISLDSGPETLFVIRQADQQTCGPRYAARWDHRAHPMVLQVEELSPLACAENEKTLWRITLIRKENQLEASHLYLEGEPEYFLLTQ